MNEDELLDYAKAVAESETNWQYGQNGKDRELAAAYLLVRDQVKHADTALLHELLDLRAENEGLKSREITKRVVIEEHEQQIADLTRKLEEAEKRASLLNCLDQSIKIRALTARAEAAERDNAAMREALNIALVKIPHSYDCVKVRPSEEWLEHGSTSFDNCACERSVILAALNPTPESTK